MTNNKEFAAELVRIAIEVPTTYYYGGFGQDINSPDRFILELRYPKNRSGVIAEGAKNAKAGTKIYDCVCLVKSTINKLATGKSGYTKKPCPDLLISEMIKQCSEVSDNMDKIEIGEFLVFGDYSHCGVYVGEIDGKRVAAESTSRFENGVQLIDIDGPYRKGLWKWHGKLTDYIEYPKADAHLDNLISCGDTKLRARKGDQNDYVQAVQLRLVDLGYNYVSPVGYFGDDTERAVKDFQKKNGCNSTGVIDVDTFNALIK